MNLNTNNPENKNRNCPFLGLREDPELHMTYTSPLNCCHGSKSWAAPVRPEHQNSHCLAINYTDSPVFVDGQDKAFPRALRMRVRARKDYYGLRRRRSPLPAFLVVALILLGAGYWLLGGEGEALVAPPSSTPFPSFTAPVTATDLADLFPPTAQVPLQTDTPDPGYTATVTPFPSLTLSPSPTYTASRTPTETKTGTPSPTLSYTPSATLVSPHAMGIPIGRVQKYLIHRVKSGENLNIWANQHSPSIEAILAVNYSLKLPIWEGAVLVLPIDMANTEDLPVFEPYQVAQEEISIEALAAALDTDPELLKYFNVTGNGEILHWNDWLLVPRTRAE